MTLEEQLRNALQHKANGIEPSADSYVKLSAKISPDTPHTIRLADRARFLAAAAAVVVVLGGIGFFATRSSDDGAVVAGPATTGSAEGTTIPAPVDDNNGEATVPEAPALQGFVAGPVRPTRQEAATAFLDLLGIDYYAVAVVDNTAEVQSSNEDGSAGGVVSILHLARVESQNGYAVAEATSDSVTIDSPVAPRDPSYDILADNDIPVSGKGTGFEATVGVEVVSAIDGTVLERTSAQAGNFGELEPYSLVVHAYGDGRAWIVARSSGGADNMTEPFAAVPVSYETPLHPVVYTVVGIPADDPDGGLNVRNEPGLPVESAGETSTTETTPSTIDPTAPIAVLPEGTTGIHIRSLVAADVDGQTWWNVEVGDIEGWVNSRYLVDAEAQRKADLEQIARDFEQVMIDDGVGAETLPWPVEGTVQIGWVANLFEVPVADAATSTYWALSRDVLEQGMAESDGFVGSMADFVVPFPEAGTDIRFEAGSPYTYAQDTLRDLGVDRNVVVIGYDEQALDKYAFRTVNLFLEETSDGLVIVAVAVDIWTP